MKKYYLLTAFMLILSAISLKLTAQQAQTDSLINTGYAIGLAFNGNDLYVTEYSQKSIFKIDVTASPIVKTDVFTFQNNDKPLDIAVHNNALYVVTVDDSKTPKVYTISKIDITTKAKTDILTNATYISGIAIRQNELYYSEYYSKKLSKINLTTLAKTDFYTSTTTAIEASGIAFNGDETYLYLAHSSDLSFTRIDVNSPTTLEYVNVTPAGPNRPFEICFNGNDMYSLEVNNELLFKLNTKGASPLVKEQVMKTLKRPRQIVYKDKALYLLELNKVSKIDLSCNADITKQGNTLTSNYVGGTYQWFDCGNNNLPIRGATSQSYTPTNSGSYAVRNMSSSCSYTSPCTPITLGLIESTFATQVKLYPNPINDKLTIELGRNYSKLTIEITTILGQVITSKTVSATNNKVVLPLTASAGIYFVRLNSKEGFASFKVIKE